MKLGKYVLNGLINLPFSFSSIVYPCIWELLLWPTHSKCTEVPTWLRITGLDGGNGRSTTTNKCTDYIVLNSIYILISVVALPEIFFLCLSRLGHFDPYDRWWRRTKRRLKWRSTRFRSIWNHVSFSLFSLIMFILLDLWDLNIRKLLLTLNDDFEFGVFCWHTQIYQ